MVSVVWGSGGEGGHAQALLLEEHLRQGSDGAHQHLVLRGLLLLDRVFLAQQALEAALERAALERAAISQRAALERAALERATLGQRAHEPPTFDSLASVYFLVSDVASTCGPPRPDTAAAAPPSTTP